MIFVCEGGDMLVNWLSVKEEEGSFSFLFFFSFHSVNISMVGFSTLPAR